MLPSSPYTMLKLSKTTSPNKLLHNDCVTLADTSYVSINQGKTTVRLSQLPVYCIFNSKNFKFSCFYFTYFTYVCTLKNYNREEKNYCVSSRNLM